MRRLTVLFLIIVLAVTSGCNGFGNGAEKPVSGSTVFPGRYDGIERPPFQPYYGDTPIYTERPQILPISTVLVLEMESRLASNWSRPSDRFDASVAIPVLGANGRTLIPRGTIVEGHVTNVQPAKWRSRSGVIGITFDSMRLRGKRIPVHGLLIPADEGAHRQMDEEGNFKGGSALKRNFLFVGGGAGGGATIAAITGASALAATGIGAAAGITASLLMKGKEAVVEHRQRMGLQLTRPLQISSSQRLTSPQWPRSIIPDSFGERLPYRPDMQRLPGPSIMGSPGMGSPGMDSPGMDSPGMDSPRTSATLVPVAQIRTERSGNGYLAVQVVAETPSSGWQIFTHYQLIDNNTTLEVRLEGWPPLRSSNQQVSHPAAPTIIVSDRDHQISRVVVHGSNGSRTVAVNAGTS